MAKANNTPAPPPNATAQIEWQYYPCSRKATPLAESVVQAFTGEVSRIASDGFDLASNEVLEALRERLQVIGFEVESGKHKDEKVCVPVLFGRGGAVEKSFDADAYHRAGGFSGLHDVRSQLPRHCNSAAIQRGQGLRDGLPVL
jgi:hypothetical protein